MNKTKAMVFGTRNRLANIVKPDMFKIGTKKIGFVNNHVYLGISLDSNMTLTPLIKDVKKRISNQIFMLRKIRKYLTFVAAVAVYKQTILPIFDYSVFYLFLVIRKRKVSCENSRMICYIYVIDLNWLTVYQLKSYI